MTTKFIQPVSMRVTQEQYERDLREPLLAMGYKEERISGFSHCPIIINNYASKMGVVSNTGGICKEDFNRHFITEYNPEYFLAVAAMTNEELGIVGEWWKCINDVVMESNKITYYSNKLYKSELENCITDTDGNKYHFWTVYSHMFKYLTKATLFDLFNHFECKSTTKKPKICDVQVCIREFNKNTERFLDAKREAVANLRESAIALAEVCKEELDKNVVVFFNKPYTLRGGKYSFVKVGVYVYALSHDRNIRPPGGCVEFKPLHEEGLTEAELLEHFRLELKEITDASDI